MILATDASFCPEAKMAGIAVWSTSARGLVAIEVLPAQTTNEAEALAAIRACAYMATWEFPSEAKIWTDSLQVVRSVRGMDRRTRGDAFSELAAMLKKHDWTIEDRPRAYVQPAHVAARGALRAWKAGRDAAPTWARSFYLPVER